MDEDGARSMRCAAVRAIVPEAVTGPAAAVVFGALPHACGAGGVTEDDDHDPTGSSFANRMDGMAESGARCHAGDGMVRRADNGAGR